MLLRVRRRLRWHQLIGVVARAAFVVESAVNGSLWILLLVHDEVVSGVASAGGVDSSVLIL